MGSKGFQPRGVRQVRNPSQVVRTIRDLEHLECQDPCHHFLRVCHLGVPEEGRDSATALLLLILLLVFLLLLGLLFGLFEGHVVAVNAFLSLFKSLFEGDFGHVFGRLHRVVVLNQGPQNVRKSQLPIVRG